MVFMSIRIIPTEQLRVITEIVVLCLCKELLYRSCAVCSVHVEGCNFCRSNGNHMSQIVGGTLIRT